MNTRVVLCSASNETYVLGLTVALCSALRGLSSQADAPVIYVLDGGIRERSWSKVQKSIMDVRSDCVLRRLRPDLGAFAGLPQDWGSSVMAYARLAFPALVNEYRILYIDSDLIVQGNLAELWEMDIGEAVMAAAVDVTAKDLGNAKLPTHELGLPESAPCLNSGLLVMNVKRWRDTDVTANALRYLREWPDHALNWDQSALNVVLYGRWKMLDTRWNTPAWLADAGKDGCSLEAPVLHFVGPHKPWMFGCHTSPSARIFFQWLDRTAWKNWRPSGMRQALKWAKYRFGKFLGDLRALLRKPRMRADLTVI
jgi:lipopolysaccharide biosynthesis glycosyltransferase